MPVLLSDDTSADRPRLEPLCASRGRSDTSLRPWPAGGSITARIAIRGAGSADLTRNLAAWLVEEPELRGRTRIVECGPPTRALGTTAVALEAALGPGGAVTVLASVAITWLRCRTGKVTITFSASNGRTVAMRHERVRNLDSKGIQDLTTQILNVLGDGQPVQDAPDRDGDRHAAA